MHSQDPKTPLASLPGLTAGQAASVEVCNRVFGPKSASQYARHLAKLYGMRPWFVCLDSSGARFFTHFKKLDKVVKNARSTTGSQKFIAKNADNWGVIF